MGPAAAYFVPFVCGSRKWERLTSPTPCVACLPACLPACLLARLVSAGAEQRGRSPSGLLARHSDWILPQAAAPAAEPDQPRRLRFGLASRPPPPMTETALWRRTHCGGQRARPAGRQFVGSNLRQPRRRGRGNVPGNASSDICFVHNFLTFLGRLFPFCAPNW